LPANCPFLETISKSADEIEFQLCKKRYVLPIEEVVLLPTDNITAESLSEEFARRLVNSLASLGILNSFLGIRVRVDESPGQGASFVWVPEVKR
jgi:6-pyruvoyltetrahydropterin/6-carboxytetrahydropterin synthase